MGFRKTLRERLVAEPVEATGTDDTIALQLVTMPATLPECFQHAELEFYSGRAVNFSAARAARRLSHASTGEPAPGGHFASTEQIFGDAKRRVSATLNSSFNLQKLNSNPPVRPLSHSWCGFGAENDLSLTLYATNCATDVSLRDATNCYYQYDAADMMGLVAGNTYTLKWTSETSEDNVEIHIEEVDFYSFNDFCVDLEPSEWIDNEYYMGLVGNSPNTFTFTMPNLLDLNCGNQGAPEFRFEIRTENGCHDGTWGEFRLLDEKDIPAGATLSVPLQYDFGGANYGISLACQECSVQARCAPPRRTPAHSFLSGPAALHHLQR